MRGFFQKLHKAVINVVPWIVALALVVVFTGFGGVDPLIAQGTTNFDALALSETLSVTGASTFSTIDVDGTADAIIVDADGDTTISADTDDQLNFELGAADELVISASTMTLADMIVSQTVGTENVGAFPTVVSTSIDIDNDVSPVTCATIGAGEIWIVHAVYVNVLDNFVATGDNATFQVGDAGDANGLIDMVDAELQTGSAEITGGSVDWYGQGAGTIGAFTAAGAGHVYDEAAGETIDCAFAGTALASTTASTASDITVYVVYTRIQYFNGG